jgi:hypothetical protein
VSWPLTHFLSTGTGFVVATATTSPKDRLNSVRDGQFIRSCYWNSQLRCAGESANCGWLRAAAASPACPVRLRKQTGHGRRVSGCSAPNDCSHELAAVLGARDLLDSGNPI